MYTATPQSSFRSARRGRRRAFTFVELLIVVLILGIVAAVAAPRTADALARLNAKAAAKRIAADLTLARRTATTTGKSQTIAFDVANNRYSLPGVSHLDRPNDDYAVDLAATGYAATLSGVDFGGSESVAFDLYGRPNNGGTVTVKSGGVTKTIVLDAETGRAEIP